MTRTAMIVLAGLLLAACQPGQRDATSSAAAADRAAWRDVTALGTTDLAVGTGAVAQPGRWVQVHYDGWVYSAADANHLGRRFDSSREKGRPFRFRLGSGTVIKGWDAGVDGMRVGGRRQLTVPADLGYGSRGAGGGVIPPGAALVFDIELLAVE